MGMIRGYDSRTLIKCFPTYFMYGYIRTLNPKMFHMLVIIPNMERVGAGMLLPLCMLLSGWCVHCNGLTCQTTLATDLNTLNTKSMKI